MMLGWPTEARADIIFSTDQGTVNPDENVLFNCVGCISGPALTVIGETQTSEIQVSFTGTENLVTPASGQARVEDEAEDGFNYLLIDAVVGTNFFSEFEANIELFAQEAGVGTVYACNQFAICETFNFDIASGNNFFVLSVVSPQLINTVRLTSSPVAMMDVKQIRVTVVSCPAGTPTCEDVTVPEPASMALIGVAMLAGGWRLRRKVGKA
jgi:hypothetical protein